MSRRQRNLHYCPADAWFGDPIPFFWDGTYHLFHMKGPRDGSASPWGHVSSRDLVSWDERPEPVRPGLPGSVDAGGCATGSVIEKDGLFHLFYTGNGSKGQTICHATSRDLDVWQKDACNPIVLPDPRWYEVSDWRDPQVLPSPEGPGYWMLIGAREKRRDDIYPYNASVALAVSQDLVRWKVQPPLASSGVMYMDCPDLFRLGSRWCMMLALRESAIRLADSPRGPWHKALRDSPDSTWAMAGKTAADGTRRLVFGFLARREGDSDRGKILWGGRMLVRELYLDGNGEPAVRFPSEVLASFDENASGALGMEIFSADSHPWRFGKDFAEVAVPDTGAVAVWRDAPRDFLFSGRVTLSGPATTAGIFVRTAREWQTVVDTGYQVLFEPDRRRVSIRPLSRWDTDDVLNETAFDFTPARPISFGLLVDGPVLEVFLDDRFAIACNLYRPAGALALMARDGTVRWDSATLRR